MSILVNNFKALVKPKEFVNLTDKGNGVTFLYTFIMSLLIMIVCCVVPTQVKLSDFNEEIVAGFEKYCPDFKLTEGKLTIRDEAEKFISADDTAVIYYNTDAPYLSMSPSSEDYLGYYLTEDQVDTLSNAETGFVISESNLFTLQYGRVDTELLWKDIQPLTGMSFIDRNYIKEKLPDLIQLIMNIYYVIVVIGAISGLYFFSLIWGLIGMLINGAVGIGYPYGHLYKMILYIQIPVMLIRQICNNVLSINASGIVTWGCRLILCLYIYFALSSKMKSDGTYRMMNTFMPNTTVGDYGSFNNNFGDYNNSNQVGGYNTNQSNEYGMNQQNGFGMNQQNNYGMNQQNGFEMNQQNNYGMNQQNGFGMNQQNNYGMNQQNGFGMNQQNNYGMNQNDSYNASPYGNYGVDQPKVNDDNNNNIFGQ